MTALFLRPENRDRILRFFLRSPHCGGISLLNYTENLGKKEKSIAEKSKGIRILRNCRFLSLVVVERVLTFGYFEFWWLSGSVGSLANSDAAFVLTTGSFYSGAFLLRVYNFSFFTYTWSFSCLLGSACKEGTVSKEAL